MPKLTIPNLNNRFIVRIDGFEEYNFQSVSEITDSSEVGTIKEIDHPFSVRRIPGYRTLSSVTLSRAMTMDLDLITWRKEAAEVIGFSDIKRNVTITVQNSSGDTIRVITLYSAWPSKLVLGGLSGAEGTILIDTLELHFDSMSVHTQ